MSIFQIKGVVQNYAWGGTSFIPELTGIQVTGENCAEYWMGAHEKAPSIVVSTGKPLNVIIEKDPVGVLGSQVAKKFGRLPFLFKVLDVQDMLSIQVHPTKDEAEKGFQRENQAGIPLSASNRNYKDDNHKPEIMVALSEFWLLHGFKSLQELKITLSETPELNKLGQVLNEQGYKGLYQYVMEESAEQTNLTLKSLFERILPAYDRGELDKTSPDYWAAKAYYTFCSEDHIDKGVYSIYFFNIVRAQKGEAIYQGAGLPHAYLEGQNIELMANSDNVLRGGLTPKHVDAPELLKHIDFSETVPDLLDGELTGVETIYKSEAPDFELSRIELGDQQADKWHAKTLEIIIIYDGNVAIDDGEKQIHLQKGEVVAITSNTHYEIKSKDALMFKAKCPI